MANEIESMVKNKVESIFTELADEYDVETGDWFPMQDVELDRHIEGIQSLAKAWLRQNKGEKSLKTILGE